MADDRPGPGADEVHDDDELADMLAAELERYATGAVPVVPRPQDPPAPAPPPLAGPPVASTRSDGHEEVGPLWLQEFGSGRDLLPDEPVRRRAGYRAPAGGRRRPVERGDATPPAPPAPTPEELQELVANTGDDPAVSRRAARHAAPPTAPSRLVTAPAAASPAASDRPAVITPPPRRQQDTEDVAVPRGLYADWEQSLRAIGRPTDAAVDDELVAGAEPDAPTVAMSIPRARSVWGPVDSSQGARRHAAPGSVETVASPPDGPYDPLQAIADRRAADAGIDAEGLDEVDVQHERVSAATTGAIELPSAAPRPRTGPVLIERVRTAILAVPAVPGEPTGSRAVAVAGRWIGAYASPLALVAGAGVAAAGGGPLTAAAGVLGALLAVPAAARSAAWAARTTDAGAREEDAVLGPVAGRVWAVVLLLARVVAVIVLLGGVGALAAAWLGRTGVLGGSASTGATGAIVVAGAVAIVLGVIPVRVAAVLVQLLAIAGAFGTVLLVLLLGPAAGPAGEAIGAVPIGAGTGFAAIGLLLALGAADVVRWRTTQASAVESAVAVTVALAAGGGLLAAGVLIAPGTGDDPADAFAGALSDGTAAALALPLAIVLVGAGLTAPALLVRSAGAAASRLIGGGRSPGLGAAATGLLALAGTLGLVAGGVDPTAAAIAAAGLAGMPVAAWAGVRTIGGGGRSRVVAVGLAVAVLVGWGLAGGLLPGTTSPVLTALHVGRAMAGGPVIGLAAAFVIGVVTGVVGRRPAPTGAERFADTVEG